MGIEDIIATCGEWIKEHPIPIIAGLAAAAGFYFLGDAAIEMTRMSDVVHPRQLALGKIVLSGSVGLLGYNWAAIQQNRALFERVRTRERGKTSSWQDIKKHHPIIPIALTYMALLPRPLGQAVGNVLEGEASFEDKRFLLKIAAQLIGLSIIAKAAMPFLDKRTSKAYVDGARATFAEWRGDHEQAAVLYKEACDRLDSRLSRLSLGQSYARQGDYLQAIQETHRAFTRGQSDDPLFDYLERSRIRKWLEHGKAVREHDRLKKAFEREGGIETGLRLAVLYYAFGHDEKAAETLHRLADQHPQNDDLRLLYALALREDGRHKEARQQFITPTESILTKGEGLRAVVESAHTVLEYEPSAFIRNVIIIKRGPYAQLETEGHWTRQIREMLHDQPVWHVPEVLAVVDRDKESYLVMKRGHGKHLEDVETVDAYARAAHLVAYLHAHMPQAWSQIGKRPIAERTRNSLRNAHFFPAVGENVLRTILQNYRPVYNAVTALPDAVNVDAHPRNILLLDDDSLLKMDNEDKGISPLGFDVANLMRGRADMNPIITAYWDAYGTYRKKEKKPEQRIEEKQFRLGCLASVVHRSIAFASAWSQPRLADMASRRKGVLEWGINAIDEIYRSHAAHFAAYQQEYTTLQRSLDSITHRLAAGA